jgi:Integrase core domain
LRRLGVTQKNGKPNHPQTQGKVERFQQTLKKWLRAQPAQPADLTQLQNLLDTASSATPTLVPIQVKFTDASGNTIVTVAPYASAAAPTSATQYNAVVAVPDGAVKATVTLAALAWASTGGYSVIMQSPTIAGF